MSPRARSAFRILLLLLPNVASSQVWLPQGPAPIVNSGSSYTDTSGALEAILVDPSVRNHVFVGSVNGGIWRTTDGVTWTAKTDQLGSLSISDIQFSPLDLNYNTLFAGIGGYSSMGFSGPLIGLLKSSDGGDTWTNLAQATLGGIKIRRVVPTAVLDSSSHQQIVLVAGQSAGIFRSTDAGNSFALVSGAHGLPVGGASDLVADPVHLQTFYAALPHQGIFRSDDAGANWTSITANLASVTTSQGNWCSSCSVLVNSDRIVLTVSPAGSQPLYAALIFHYSPDSCGSASPYDIFRWNGTSWDAMGLRGGGRDLDAGGGGCLKFALLAHATDPNVVFAAGDLNPDGTGSVWRGSINNWVSMTGPDANNTGPHPDGRALAYDFNGQDILESSDGGLEKLLNPDDSSRSWQSMNGNLQVTEFATDSTANHLAYDTLNNITFGGAQDVGCAQQSSAGSTVWEQVIQGDGTWQAVDNSDPSKTLRYYTDHNYLSLPGGFQRRDYDRHNSLLQTVTPKFADPATPNSVNSGFKHGIGGGFVLNKVRPSRLLLFGAGLYEGTVDASGNGNYGDTINDITIGGQQSYAAAAYGASNNPDAIYLSVLVNGSWGLYLRTTAGGAFQKLNSFPGGQVLNIAMDPSDWTRAYVVSGAKVYQTTSAGATWTDITGALPQLGAGTLYTVELLSPSAFPHEVVLVGGVGGVYFTSNPNQGSQTPWARFGSGLPKARVSALTYYPGATRANGPVGDVLVVGTVGRGAWAIPHASYAIFYDPCFEYGQILSVPSPYNSVTSAYNAAGDCNVIRINAATYHEAPITFRKHVLLEAQGGAVTIRP